MERSEEPEAAHECTRFPASPSRRPQSGGQHAADRGTAAADTFSAPGFTSQMEHSISVPRPRCSSVRRTRWSSSTAGLNGRLAHGQDEPLLHNATRERSSGPSLTAGCVVPRIDRYYDRPDSLPAPRPLPGSAPVIGSARPRHRRARRPGRASPVPAATVSTFRVPYAGESLAAASRINTASMAFAVSCAARLSLDV